MCSSDLAECHVRRHYAAHPGHYDRTHTCPACGAIACWSCLYTQRKTPALLCLVCARGVRDPGAPELDARARVHTFAHDVILGDFSHEEYARGGMARVVARYVLRNQLFVAAQYTLRCSDTTPTLAVAAAREYLREYGFAKDGCTMYHTAVQAYAAIMAADPKW